MIYSSRFITDVKNVLFLWRIFFWGRVAGFRTRHAQVREELRVGQETRASQEAYNVSKKVKTRERLSPQRTVLVAACSLRCARAALNLVHYFSAMSCVHTADVLLCNDTVCSFAVEYSPPLDCNS